MGYLNSMSCMGMALFVASSTTCDSSQPFALLVFHSQLVQFTVGDVNDIIQNDPKPTKFRPPYR